MPCGCTAPAFAISTEVTRYYLCGLLVHDDGRRPDRDRDRRLSPREGHPPRHGRAFQRSESHHSRSRGAGDRQADRQFRDRHVEPFGNTVSGRGGAIRFYKQAHRRDVSSFTSGSFRLRRMLSSRSTGASSRRRSTVSRRRRQATRRRRRRAYGGTRVRPSCMWSSPAPPTWPMTW